MRRCLRFLVLPAFALFLAGCGKDVIPEEPVGKTDPLDAVFNPAEVPEVHVSVSLDEWNRLLAAYDENSGTSEYVRCDVGFVRNGVSSEFHDAGFRLKGNTSRRRPESAKTHAGDAADWHHFHFGINLHKFAEPGAPELDGISRMDFKWFKDDPAYVREPFCFETFRSFGVWTALHESYIRVWIRVEGDSAETYLGVYGFQEHIDKDYIKARRDLFGSVDGDLWKCRYPAWLDSASDDLFGIDDGVHTPAYELKSDPETFEAAKARLKEFISRTRSYSGDKFRLWFSQAVDMDLFLRTCAVDVAVGMWDDFWNNGNNYYLYLTSSGKAFFLPFDYDNTLGTSLNCGVQNDAGRQNPYEWGGSKLMAKILADPEWKAAYKGYLQQLCGGGGLLNPVPATARLTNWQALIRDFVPNDTGEDMAVSDRPAPWGNHGEYRIMTDGPDNFFRVKAAVVNALP